jgi:hypothetical protein
MHLKQLLVASLGASSVLAVSSVHKRAAKYERKNSDLVSRRKAHVTKQESSSYLTAKTKRESSRFEF